MPCVTFLKPVPKVRSLSFDLHGALLAGAEPSVRHDSAQENIADTATLHMEFSLGLKSHVFVSWLHPYKEHQLVVVGEDAMAVFDEKLAVYRHLVSPDDAPERQTWNMLK